MANKLKVMLTKENYDVAGRDGLNTAYITSPKKWALLWTMSKMYSLDITLWWELCHFPLPSACIV